MTAYLTAVLALWPWIVAAVVVLAVFAHYDEPAPRKAARTHAAHLAAQERADVAGRKANADSVRWVG